MNFQQPNIIRISHAGEPMPLDAKGHAIVRYPDFGIEFAVGAKDASRNRDYDDTVKYCNDLDHVGGGWIIAPDLRLQLLTVDYLRHDPAADPELYPDAASAWYWTAHGCSWATEEGKAPRAFWQVYGPDGSVDCGFRSSDGFVRPCRLVAPGQ
jgi:hypothetical protein